MESIINYNEKCLLHGFLPSHNENRFAFLHKNVLFNSEAENKFHSEKYARRLLKDEAADDEDELR